jgi:hypothetical protein
MTKVTTEDMIKDAGLTAPRVTPAMIEAAIEETNFHRLNGTLMVCQITLVNGFSVTGESACASPENFNLEIGMKISYDNAKAKIWALEGYLLKQKLYEVPVIGEHDQRVYISHKKVHATPMTRATYNDYRGWDLPVNENGSDEGYLVEYLDGGEGNDPDHKGYISWSPKAPFDAGYNLCDKE